MAEDHSLEEIRNKAHSINSQLSDEGFSPRDIEIVGYYLNRIAASYLSYFTHKEYESAMDKKPNYQK
ncbi:MAG: hypothetical protein KAJ44_07545 [Thermoplasmatales archaeon]|nr:hypothetical protein [Thermoplasmatales archaeon]